MFQKVVNILATSSKTQLILLIAILSALSYNYAFNFYLYADDWYQIIGALHYPEILLGYTLGLHPVLIPEYLIFSPIFKTNAYLWQFLGYLLKIIDSLSMWFFMMALVNSKKASLYACLIFAVLVVGLESFSWVAVHSSAIIVPLISLGFYFWVRAQNFKNIKYFSLSLMLCILAEPGRAYMLIPMVIFWEILTLYQILSFKVVPSFLLKTSILILLTFSSSIIVQKVYGISISRQFFQGTLEGWIHSISNLIFGWTLIPQNLSFILTIFSFLLVLVCLFLFIWKRKNIYKTIIFLYFWMWAFYLPNFLTQAHSQFGVPVESRYYTISAMGLVGILALGFSYIKIKNIAWVLVPFLIFNIYVSNKILTTHSTYRSTSFNNKVWNKIDQDVPKGELESVFMYTGANFELRSKILDYADSIPFAMKRGIVEKKYYPIVTNDPSLIARLLCEKNVSRHSPFGDIIQQNSIPLSHIHAWEFKNGELENRSEQEREKIKKIAKCL